MNKTIISIFSVLVVGSLAFAGYYYQSVIISPNSASNSTYLTPLATSPNTFVLSVNTFNLVLNLSSGQKSLQENFTDGENLYDALKAATAKEGISMTSKEYPRMGYLVESIGGEKNGTDGKYWQFLVNGKYANEGASSYRIKTGDVIEWKFSNEQ